MNSVLDHCLASYDWPGLESYLQQHAESILGSGQGTGLAGVLLDIPASVLDELPWIRYWLGRSQLQTDLLAARPSLESSYHQFLASDDRGGEVAALSAVLDALWLEWDNCSALDPWLDRLANLRRRLQAEGRKELLVSTSRSAFAGLSIRRPEDEDLAYWESLSLQALSRENYSADFLLRCLQLMIHYTWGRGDRAHSSLVLETLRSKFGKLPADPVGSCIFFVVQAAHQYWFDENIESCGRTVQQGLEASEANGLQHWEIPLLNCELYKVCGLQQMDEIEASLDLLGTRIQLNPRPHDQAIHYHFRAYDAWLRKRNDEAQGFVRQAYQIALDSGFAYSPVYYGVAYAAIEFARGDVQQALILLGRSRRLATRQNSDSMRFVALMQGAVISMKRKRWSAVSAYLREALAIAARQCYFSVPWLTHRELAQLMLVALENKLETKYVTQLIIALKLEPPASTHLSIAWPWSHRVRILGKVEIVSQHGLQTETAAKAPVSLYRLLFHIVAAGPDGVSTERLQEQLWPESEDTQSYARLKTSIGRLRNLFNERSAIVLAHQRVSLNPKYVWVDAWALEQAANRVQTLDSKTIIEVLSIWGGQPESSMIKDVSLLYYPARLEDAYLQLVREVTARCEAEQDWDKALKFWRMAAAEIQHEPVLAGMARCLKALGREIESNRLQALIHDPG